MSPQNALKLARRRQHGKSKANMLTLVEKENISLLPYTEEFKAEVFFKHVDDGAARFIRSIFLFGSSLFLLLLLSLLFREILEVFTVEASLSGLLRWIVLVIGSFLTMAGVVVISTWGWVVLKSVINALIITRRLPSSGMGISWLFGNKASSAALFFLGVAIALLLLSALVLGSYSAKELITVIVKAALGI